MSSKDRRTVIQKEKRYTDKTFDSLQGSCVGFVLAGRKAARGGMDDLINEYVL